MEDKPKSKRKNKVEREIESVIQRGKTMRRKIIRTKRHEIARRRRR